MAIVHSPCCFVDIRRAKLIWGIYIIIGIVLMMISTVIQDDYYSTMIFSMGVGIAASSIVQTIRYYHNTRPENIEAYHHKLRSRQIDLKDERKVQLRNLNMSLKVSLKKSLKKVVEIFKKTVDNSFFIW